jgi:hypothetical protein
MIDAICRSIAVIVVDDDHLLSLSSPADVPAPLLDALRCTADVSPAAAISSPSIEGAYMAAFGVDVLEVDGFEKPVRTNAYSLMDACTGNSAAVEPPALAAQELTH